MRSRRGFLGRTRDLRVLGSSKNVLPDFYRVPCRAAGRPEGPPRWPASSWPAHAGRAHPVPRGPHPRPALSRVDARAAGGARRPRRSGSRSPDGARADTRFGADGDSRARGGASIRRRACARRPSSVELDRGPDPGHSTARGPRASAGRASRRRVQPRAADRRALVDVGGRGRDSLRRRVRGEALHREQSDRAARAARRRSPGRPRPARRGIDPPPPSRRAISLGGPCRPRAGPLLSLALRGIRLLRSPPGRHCLRAHVHRHRARHGRGGGDGAPGDGCPRAPGWAPHPSAPRESRAQRARSPRLSRGPRPAHLRHRALSHLARAQSARMGRHRPAPGSRAHAPARGGASRGPSRSPLVAPRALPPHAARARVEPGRAQPRGGSPHRGRHGSRLLLGRLHHAPGLEAPASTVLAILYALLAGFYRRRVPDDDATVGVLIGLACVFLILAIPLALGGPWITLAWAAEGAVLLAVAPRLATPVAAWGGTAALVLAALRVVAGDKWGSAAWTPVWNATFLVHLLTVADIVLAGQLALRLRPQQLLSASREGLRSALWVLASLTLSVLLWREPSGLWPAGLLTIQLLLLGFLSRVVSSSAFVAAVPLAGLTVL